MASNLPALTYDNLLSLKDVIKNSVAKGATDAQMEVFIRLAASYELDPFLGEIFYSKELARPITSRDGYMKIANRDPDFQGINSFAVRETDTLDIDMTGDQIKLTFQKNLKFRGRVIGAFAVGYHKKWHTNCVRWVDIEEYDKGSSGAWKYKTAMIRKVAEVQVLKAIARISGLTTVEEVGEASEEASKIIDVVAVEQADVDDGLENISSIRIDESGVSIRHEDDISVGDAAVSGTEDVRSDTSIDVPVRETHLFVPETTEHLMEGLKEWFEISKMMELPVVLSTKTEQEIAQFWSGFWKKSEQRRTVYVLQYRIISWMDIPVTPGNIQEFCKDLILSSNDKKDKTIELLQLLGLLSVNDSDLKIVIENNNDKILNFLSMLKKSLETGDEGSDL